MLKVKYFDRNTNELVSLDLPADVVAVLIPEQAKYNGQPDWNLPALEINVNTDAVIIDKANGEKLALYEYSELLAETSE